MKHKLCLSSFQDAKQENLIILQGGDSFLYPLYFLVFYFSDRSLLIRIISKCIVIRVKGFINVLWKQNKMLI